MASVDPVRLALSWCFINKDLSPLISAELHVEGFEDEEHQEVFDWALKHYRDHAESPGIDALRLFDPNYRIEEPTDNVDVYIEDIKRNIRYTVLTTTLQQSSALADKNEDDEAIAVLTRGVAELNQAQNSSYDEDITLNTKERWQHYDDLRSNPGALRGWATGFHTIDVATGGIQPHQFIVIGGFQKSGKAQPLDEVVLTPSGWVPMRDIKIGSWVISQNGCNTRVLGMRDWDNREIVKVTTDDGGSVLVDIDHDWTLYPYGKKARIYSTRVLRDKLKNGQNNIAFLAMVDPVEHPEQKYDLHPWLMGAFLGDGSACDGTSVRFTKVDAWMHNEVQKLVPADVTLVWVVPGITSRLRGANHYVRDLNLMGKRSWEKHIPGQYLIGSVQQRKDLLAGLLDTDGGMSGKSIEWCTTSVVMAEQFQQLVWSLGGCCVGVSRVTRHQNGEGRRSYRYHIRLPYGNPFRLPRKRSDYDNRGSERARRPLRRIVSIETVGVGPTRCIEVSDSSGLYVTRDYIVTHNSTALMVMGKTLNEQGAKCLLVSFEMSAAEQKARWDALWAEIAFGKLMSGRTDRRDMAKLRRVMERMEGRFPFILTTDIGRMTTVSGVAAKIEKHKPDVCLVDGMYLMMDDYEEPPGSPQALTNITRDFKRLAQHSVPIIGTTQASRAKTTRRRGITSESFSWSQSFGQDADVLIGLQPADEEEETEAEIRVLESRHGPRVRATIIWDWQHMKFEEVYSDGTNDDSVPTSATGGY